MIVIGSTNLTSKRLDTGYYDFMADGHFDEETLSRGNGKQ